MKRIGRFLVAALFASAVWTSSAQAVEGFFIVNLEMVGAQDQGETYVLLSDAAGTPTFTSTWFRVVSPIKTEALAMALTVIATDSQILVEADPDASPIALVLRFFVISK